MRKSARSVSLSLCRMSSVNEEEKKISPIPTEIVTHQLGSSRTTHRMGDGENLEDTEGVAFRDLRENRAVPSWS